MSIVGASLLSQLQNALAMRSKHKTEFEKLSQTFGADDLARWNNMIEAWNDDPRQPNPFQETIRSRFKLFST